MSDESGTLAAATVLAADGQVVALGGLFAEGPVVVLFLRHFG